MKSLPKGLLTWISEADSVKSSREAIILCIQQFFNLDNQFVKQVRVAWQARILLVYSEINVSELVSPFDQCV